MRNTTRTKRKVTGGMLVFILTILVLGALAAAGYLSFLPPGEVQPAQ